MNSRFFVSPEGSKDRLDSKSHREQWEPGAHSWAVVGRP